jgi:hypothetical protein
MRRNTTLVYLILLAVVLGAYYFINNRAEPAEIALTLEPQAVATYLFDAEDGVPSRIRIESKAGESVEVARGEDGAWALTLPLEASADQAAAEAAASQVTTLRVESTIADIPLDAIGLEEPEYTLTVTFKDGLERTAEIGVITPTESGYYVLSPAGDVVIISKFSLDSVLGLLSNPPYLETPTPSPIPTETSTAFPPTSEAGTPTSAGTGTPAP